MIVCHHCERKPQKTCVPLQYLFVTSCINLTFDAGGRIYVIGIYFALLLALVTTFFAINCYMNLSARLAPDSPYYSSALVSFMSQNIFATYTTCWVVIVLLFVIFFYVCV
jgi:hypothetical protein